MKLTTQDMPVLQEYQWKNRIILVFANTQNQLHQQQIEIFNENPSGMRDRDLLGFTILPEKVIDPKEKVLSKAMADEFRQKYRVRMNEFAVILIGKDGGQKLHQTKLLTTDQLFGIIDQMPMRKREMREKPG